MSSTPHMPVDPDRLADALTSLLLASREKRAEGGLSGAMGSVRDWVGDKAKSLAPAATGVGDWLKDPNNSVLRSGLVGAGLGGLYGAVSQQRKPEEERQTGRAALTGALAGGAVGAGGAAALSQLGKPSADPRHDGVDKQIAAIEQARAARTGALLPNWAYKLLGLRDKPEGPATDPGRQHSLLMDYARRAAPAYGVAVLGANHPHALIHRAVNSDTKGLGSQMAAGYADIASGSQPGWLKRLWPSLHRDSWRANSGNPGEFHLPEMPGKTPTPGRPMTHAEVRNMLFRGRKLPNKFWTLLTLGGPALWTALSRAQHQEDLDRWINEAFPGPTAS